jgi:hypothetical protein
MYGLEKKLTVRLRREQPVVVMGRGHSGTRIVAWALVELGIRMGTIKAKATGDCQDRRFTGTIKKLARRTLHLAATATPNQRDLHTFQKAVHKYLDWMGDISPAWGWKFPETYLIGNIVEATFPDARYIHMIRDGRDLAFKMHLTDDPNRGLGRALLKHLNAVDKPDYFQAALSWDFQVRRFSTLAAELGDRLHTLTFEALCRNPIGEMEKIASFLDVPMTNDCRNYLKDEVNPTKVAQFRKENAAKVAEVENLLSETLTRYGYD